MAGETGQLNLAQYAENKAKGLAKIVNVEGLLHYVERRFHPQTGEPTPQFVPLAIDSLKRAREDVAKNLAALDELIADAEKAKTSPSV